MSAIFYNYNVDFSIHLHNAMELMAVITGTGTAIQDGKSYFLQPGDLFVSFSNQVHSYIDSHPDLKTCIAIFPVIPICLLFTKLLIRKSPFIPFCTRRAGVHQICFL